MNKFSLKTNHIALHCNDWFKILMKIVLDIFLHSKKSIPSSSYDHGGGKKLTDFIWSLTFIVAILYSRPNIIGGGWKNCLIRKSAHAIFFIPDQTSLVVVKKLPDKKVCSPQNLIPDETSLVVENKSRLQRTRHHQRLSWLCPLHWGFNISYSFKF